MQREGITEDRYCAKYGVKHKVTTIRQLRRLRKRGEVDAVRIRNPQAAKGKGIIVIDAPPNTTPRATDPELAIIQQEVRQIGKAMGKLDERIDRFVTKKGG